ncbi:MAG TPA: YgiQ family radical SAM protein [Candidatus Nanoarchaeia archaeon]|nr:YgiQ family radical SAM protein [Candidatus Nanoarchaeia archaeon]
MEYDVIFVTGEKYFDHHLCGIAILKRLLEREDYLVAVVEQPQSEEEIKQFGKPRLFFGITSGGIDSMVRNYTALKRLRSEDENLNYTEKVPDRAIIVYCNWIRKNFKDSLMVLGGTEASLRRFVHYDYWDNKLRKPILLDSRADILVYGNAEKQVLEISKRVKENKDLFGIEGTCVLSKEDKEGFVSLPDFNSLDNEKFVDMQNLLSNCVNLKQKIDNRYVLQFKYPKYTSEDLDSFYSLDFSRSCPEELRGFEFSVVTHRGCIGKCNFCSLNLIQGDRIVSRSEKSILDEVKKISKLRHFKGNIDNLGGPTANMYGMDCDKCAGSCIDCSKLNRSNKRLINLLKEIGKIVRKVYIKSGVRYDLCSDEYIKELEKYNFESIRIAPEHVNKNVLRLMNKDKGDLKNFLNKFKGKMSFYYMAAHPGCSMKEANELKGVDISEIQIFTPTPMTNSTCMYYTGLDLNKKKIYVPYSFKEKKEQKRIILQ